MTPALIKILDALPSGFRFDRRLDEVPAPELLDRPMLLEAVNDYFAQDDTTSTRITGERGTVTVYDMEGKELERGSKS